MRRRVLISVVTPALILWTLVIWILVAFGIWKVIDLWS
jgi:hypothetical protein